MGSLSTAEVDGGMPERMGFFSGEKYVGIFFFCLLGWKGTLASGKDFMLFSGTKFLLESQNFRR